MGAPAPPYYHGAPFQPTRTMRRLALTTILASLLLIACRSTPEPRETAAETEPTPDWLAEVRAAVAASEPSFEVQPLRDPAVEDLRAQAARLESQAAYREAIAALDQALALSPADPELRQWRAELLLGKGLLDEAEAAAAEAFESGPRVGSLCLRSWHTVRVARLARGQEDGAEVAAAMLDRCRVEPPPRM
jgi:tetratricopeptide (TPR) repeat protein